MVFPRNTTEALNIAAFGAPGQRSTSGSTSPPGEEVGVVGVGIPRRQPDVGVDAGTHLLTRRCEGDGGRGARRRNLDPALTLPVSGVDAQL